jgi:DNA-binding transcriptional regulator YhcF (GntR family)
MEKLDPNDGRPPVQQVTSVIKAAIATREFEPGDKLPSIAELGRHFEVAPMTVQKAIGILRDEGLIVSRQGKGLFVRLRTERTVGLRPHIEQAFERGDVRIDFSGFSGETLYGVIQEPLDKIRAGQLGATSVHLRILVPDLSKPIGLPALAPTGDDSEDVRARMERIVARSTQAIVDTVSELVALGIVETGSADVRTVHMAPLFKLFIINESEAFFGFYPVVRHSVAIKGAPVDTFDPMGIDATLFHFAVGDDDQAVDNQYVEQAQRWFNSVWDSVAAEYAP